MHYFIKNVPLKKLANIIFRWPHSNLLKVLQLLQKLSYVKDISALEHGHTYEINLRYYHFLFNFKFVAFTVGLNFLEKCDFNEFWR